MKKVRQYNGQRLEDTKGVTRSRTWKKVRQYDDQKLEDTKTETRNRTSKKFRQYDDQKLEDTRGVTRSRTSKKVRQYDDQKKKKKNIDLQNTTQIANTNPIKNGVALTAPQVAPLMLLLFQQLIICA